MVGFFDEQVLDLQKEYARKLLTHRNAYTQRTYAEDPAVAFVEINNENGLIHAWLGKQVDGLPAIFGPSLGESGISGCASSMAPRRNCVRRGRPACCRRATRPWSTGISRGRWMDGPLSFILVLKRRRQLWIVRPIRWPVRRRSRSR